MPIVKDDGFHADTLNAQFVALDELPANGPVSVDVPSDAAMDELLARLADLDAVRIDFPSFADGRGFTIARLLRQAGFQGRLRARGHVIADQYAMARRAGFDEVEIDDALATRKPEAQWIARADWQANDYQARLGRRRA